MDTEIKDLLIKLVNKFDTFEKRIEALEKNSHKQITVDDYVKKRDYVDNWMEMYPLRSTNDWRTTVIC